LDQQKRLLNSEKDRNEWITDAWNASKGTTGLLGLIPEWKTLTETDKEKRQAEWRHILQHYYSVKYCEKVNKFTNPRRTMHLLNMTSGMFLLFIVYF